MYGKNITVSFSGTWPISHGKGRASTTVWYGDFPDPFYKTDTIFYHDFCDDPEWAVKLDICKYKEGEIFKGVIEVPLFIQYYPGWKFVSGWYKFKCILYNQLDEEAFCAEFRVYIIM